MRYILMTTVVCLAGACASKPEPSADPTPVEPRPDVSEPAPADTPDTATPNQLTYNWYEGRTRVYLPPMSPICEGDDQAQPRYAVDSLWRFDAQTEEWSVVDVNSSGNWRIGCNAMLDLIDVFGFDLEVGTYAIGASLDGITEKAVFTVGPDQCEAATIIQAPPGKVVACVPVDSGAELRHVVPPEGF